MTLVAHPFAEIFPMLPDEDAAELAADIHANGLREKIVLFEGKILDGRNRYAAVLAAGLIDHDDGPECTSYFKRFMPELQGDPIQFVLSMNLHRRHLTDRQRQSIAGEIASLGRGRPSKENPPIGGLSAEQAAATLNVAPRQVERSRVVHEAGVPELREAFRRGKVPTTVAENIARMPEAAQHDAVARFLPNGARSIMSSRVEADDSLDYFPTPPWATRALFHHVLAHLKVGSVRSAWDPACGEGHMAEAMRAYVSGPVYATDIHAYGYGGLLNYLTTPWHTPADVGAADWVISNPPFKDRTEPFVARALAEAKVGVAMFVRMQWLETKGRYERIFSINPPTLIAFFAERVPLCKGCWNPDGDTATAYVWLVWIKGRQPEAPFWIPPTCRDELTREDDEERYTAHPVIKALHKLVRQDDGAAASRHDLETGELMDVPAPPAESPTGHNAEHHHPDHGDEQQAGSQNGAVAHEIASPNSESCEEIDIAAPGFPRPGVPECPTSAEQQQAATDAERPAAQAPEHEPDQDGSTAEHGAPPEMSPADNSDHDIPTFLRRGHEDCVVGREDS